MSALDGLSVLLLEDEYLIALDAEEILKSLGVKRIRIVNTLASAAEAAKDDTIDVAILDLNINGEMSLGIAQQLRQHHVPIVFASGYELRDKVGGELEEGGVVLKKPYTAESLKEALLAALSKPMIAPPAGEEIGSSL